MQHLHFKKQIPWLTEVLWILAISFSISNAVLYARPIEFVYLAISSFFIYVLFFSICTEVNNCSLKEKSSRVISFLLTYIFMSIWFMSINVLPDYYHIKEFYQQRDMLVSKLMINNGSGQEDKSFRIILELANLYLYAPAAVNKVEKEVNRIGGFAVINLLDKKINENNGGEYKNEIYVFAESLFEKDNMHDSKKWFAKAYDAGRSQAKKRYNELLQNKYKGNKSAIEKFVYSEALPFENEE